MVSCFLNLLLLTPHLHLSAKRQDEDYDEQVEETLQDEVKVNRRLRETWRVQA